MDETIQDEFDPEHIFTNTWFERWLEVRGKKPTFVRGNDTIDRLAADPFVVDFDTDEERRDSQTMQKADMGRTDEGVTVLESGALLMHHNKDVCNGEPCSLHNPMSGPWEDWPRFYLPSNSGIYRVCPHAVAHPAVEQVIHWMTLGKEYLIPHRCCDQGCVCMPRVAVPESYFNGPRIGVPMSLQGWAGDDLPYGAKATEPEAMEPVSAQEESSNEPTGNERDPNWYASQYLYRYRLDLDPRFYALLHTNMLMSHRIGDVQPVHALKYDVSCNDDCDVILTKDDVGGHWHNVGNSFCPTIEIALFAGWTPVEWDEDEEDDEEDDE